MPLFDDSVPLGREQLEQLARPILDRTVTATLLAVAAAGLTPAQLSAVFLVGGSSRIPLAATLLHRGFGTAPTAIEQPELVVAEGALQLAPRAGRAVVGPAGAPVGPANAGPGAPGPVPTGPGAGAARVTRVLGGMPSPVSAPPTVVTPMAGPRIRTAAGSPARARRTDVRAAGLRAAGRRIRRPASRCPGRPRPGRRCHRPASRCPGQPHVRAARLGTADVRAAHSGGPVGPPPPADRLPGAGPGRTVPAAGRASRTVGRRPASAGCRRRGPYAQAAGRAVRAAAAAVRAGPSGGQPAGRAVHRSRRPGRTRQPPAGLRPGSLGQPVAGPASPGPSLPGQAPAGPLPARTVRRPDTPPAGQPSPGRCHRDSPARRAAEPLRRPGSDRSSSPARIRRPRLRAAQQPADASGWPSDDRVQPGPSSAPPAHLPPPPPPPPPVPPASTVPGSAPTPWPAALRPDRLPRTPGRPRRPDRPRPGRRCTVVAPRPPGRPLRAGTTRSPWPSGPPAPGGHYVPPVSSAPPVSGAGRIRRPRWPAVPFGAVPPPGGAQRKSRGPLIAAISAAVVVLVLAVGGIAFALRPRQEGRPGHARAGRGGVRLQDRLPRHPDRGATAPTAQTVRNAVRLAAGQVQPRSTTAARPNSSSTTPRATPTRPPGSPANWRATRRSSASSVRCGSDEAQKVMPILDAAGIPAISPYADVHRAVEAGLEDVPPHRRDRRRPGRPRRRSTSRRTLRAQQVFIVADNDEYAAGGRRRGPASRLNTAFAGRADIDGQRDDLRHRRQPDRRRPAADAVYFAGYYDAGADLREGAAAAKPDIKIVAWDRLFTDLFVDGAGKAAAEGVVITCPCVPPSEARDNFANDFTGALRRGRLLRAGVLRRGERAARGARRGQVDPGRRARVRQRLRRRRACRGGSSSPTNGDLDPATRSCGPTWSRTAASSRTRRSS